MQESLPEGQKVVRRHRYHSPLKRGIYSLILVSSVVGIGTLGIHFIEGFSCVDSFYFTSMIATGQGPVGPLSPVTPLGKLFTSFLAFISAGSMLAAFGFLFGPFLGKLWRIGVWKLEEELHDLGQRKEKENKR